MFPEKNAYLNQTFCNKKILFTKNAAVVLKCN